MNLKPAIQATEDTEMKRVLYIFPVRLMGEVNSYGKQLFLRDGRRVAHLCEPRCLCELCVLCGELIFQDE